ncbi:replication regulatory protein RepA [Erwinia sp. V71]|uniref:replication regulatory protein RepA n=1 Tax=Erwinia sp. V71 TaxID=3369424 RepID=UPI003F615B0D
MPQPQSSAEPPKQKRAYRKGSPLTNAEKKRRSVARKKETHKEVNVFIRNAHKEHLRLLCEDEGVTQAEMIEKLIEYRLGENFDHSFK